MRYRVLVATLVLALSAGVAPAAELPLDSVGQLRLLEERAVKLAADKPGKYAKDYITSAQANIAAARSAIATQNEKLAQQNLEAGTLQLNISEMKVVEKELGDELAVRKEELKKQESRLERYLQGEENVK